MQRRVSGRDSCSLVPLLGYSSFGSLHGWHLLWVSVSVSPPQGSSSWLSYPSLVSLHSPLLPRPLPPICSQHWSQTLWTVSSEVPCRVAYDQNLPIGSTSRRLGGKRRKRWGSYLLSLHFGSWFWLQVPPSITRDPARWHFFRGSSSHWTLTPPFLLLAP